MVIDFSQHSEQRINFEHVYKADEIDLNDEAVQIAGDLQVKGAARRSSEIVKVHGNLLGKLEVSCYRCLKPVEVGLNIDFDEEFVTLETYEKSNAEHLLTGEDFSLSVYDGERIDIGEIAREQVLLNLPSHQLCDEACAGLCPKCGTNKNTDACSCETKEIDPRWNALKELKRNT
jgi:uncharacterized protein